MKTTFFFSILDKSRKENPDLNVNNCDSQITLAFDSEDIVYLETLDYGLRIKCKSVKFNTEYSSPDYEKYLFHTVENGLHIIYCLDGYSLRFRIGYPIPFLSIVKNGLCKLTPQGVSID